MNLVTQRRLWIAIIPAAVIAANAFGIPITDTLLETTGDKVITGVMGLLSLWSYFQPKTA